MRQCLYCQRDNPSTAAECSHCGMPLPTPADTLNARSQQRFAVFLGDLVVVGMDLAEGEEPVAVAAEIDEGRLQRGFDPGYLGEIDVALDLLVFGRFKVEFLNPVALQNRHPGFFRVARIDKHARCH